MSCYSLYGTRLIENDETLKDFAVSIVKNIPIDDMDYDEYIEVIRGSLVDDISRTDIDYADLLYKYRGEIGSILYEMDNNGWKIPNIDFFHEKTNDFFNSLILAYIELILLSEEYPD